MIPRKLIFLVFLHRDVRVYLWCDFASNPIVVTIRRINSQRNVSQRLEEEIANVGAPPMAIKFLHLKNTLIWNKLWNP